MEEMHADRIEQSLEPDTLSVCDEIDMLESAVTLRQKLQLGLRGSKQVLVVLPTDVTTHDGADFLEYTSEDGTSARVDVREVESIELVE